MVPSLCPPPDTGGVNGFCEDDCALSMSQIPPPIGFWGAIWVDFGSDANIGRVLIAFSSAWAKSRIEG